MISHVASCDSCPGGFISKFAIVRSGVALSEWLPLGLAVASGALTMLYMFRTWQTVFQTKGEVRLRLYENKKVIWNFENVDPDPLEKSEHIAILDGACLGFLTPTLLHSTSLLNFFFKKKSKRDICK